MDGQPGWIELAGQRVRLDWVRANPYRYGRSLATARAARSAVCLCRPQRLRLVTRAGLGGRHHVACWPHEGPEHHPSCPFFHLEPELSGRGRYTPDAIQVSPQQTSIRFELPLATRPVQRAAAAESHTSQQRGGQRNTVGLLGLLHYLWETAGLTCWPGPECPAPQRNWPTISTALCQHLTRCTINTSPAGEAVYVVPPYRPATSEQALQRFDAFLDGLGGPGPSIRRGLLVAEVKDVNRAAHGVSYQLAQQSPRRQVFVSTVRQERIRAAYPRVFDGSGNAAGARRIGLFYLERSPAGYATAVDAALMLTSANYIPVDSSYEIAMAAALQAAGRAFVKPLRYDASDQAVFPDFVLTDEPRSFVDLWGLPGRRDYERRKAAKRAFYQRSARHLLEWTVTEPLPRVPLSVTSTGGVTLAATRS